MTENEFKNALAAIYADAKSKVSALIKSQKYKVFIDDYAFHRYIKYKEKDMVLSASSALNEYARKDGRGVTIVFASPETVRAERKRIKLSAIEECKRSIKYGKELIVKNEETLRKLKRIRK